jgi:DNA-binding MarR family transcriptional regulator
VYRQNTVLNDFVNFLKARGRFRDIEFIDNSVHATPRIPDFPSLVFYIEENRSEQDYTLEIHGDESTVMNREIREFFNLNQLSLRKIRVKYSFTTKAGEPLIIEVEGIGSPFETLTDHIITLLDNQDYSISTTQKTLVFGQNSIDSIDRQVSNREITREIPRVSPKSSTIPVITPKDTFMEDFERKSSSQTKDQFPPESNSDHLIEEYPAQEASDLIPISTVDTEVPSSSPLISEVSNFEEDSEEIGFTMDQDSDDETESDIFHPSPPQKSYSDNIQPYLKQTTSLFRRDNWEEDLPTETEMEILERTYMRIKHRTKPEILAKDINISIDEAEMHLRSLISKGLLRTQVGWYIIKKSHLPFFKKTFSDGERKKKKKKSPRISRVGEGLTPEEISTIKAIKSRPNLKAQSNLLTRPTGLKQSVLKEVLRNLVEKGILRVSYGWYILKDKHILEHKRGSSLNQAKESIQYKMPKDVDLSSSEEEVIKALLQRPHYKAQSNLLTSDVKLPKEQIKQVLRDLVEKEICAVKYGWYVLKKPKQFQSS